MQSKILFLGTGGDATVVGKQKRMSGGIILKIEGYQFHLDPGPGSLSVRNFTMLILELILQSLYPMHI